MRRLAILLRSQLSRCKPLPSARLDLLGKRLRIELACGSAVETLLNLRTQPFQLGFPALLAFLDQAQAVADDFAGGRVAAALDQPVDEGFEMLANSVAGCHGHLRIGA